MSDLFDKNLTFQQLAEIAVEQEGGDGEKAKARLQEFARNNPEWAIANMETLITRRMTDAVSHYLKDRRKSLTGSAQDILDWPIWGGKSLGNVSLKEIATAAHKWKRDGETRKKKADWLLEIVAEGQRNQIDPTGSGAARLIPKAELELIFAKAFGDGWVQDELDISV